MYLVAGTYDMNESVAYFPAATTPAPLITAGSKWPSPPVLRGVGFNSTVIRRAITAGSTTGGVEPVPKQKKSPPAARCPPTQRGGGGPLLLAARRRREEAAALLLLAAHHRREEAPTLLLLPARRRPTSPPAVDSARRRHPGPAPRRPRTLLRATAACSPLPYLQGKRGEARLGKGKGRRRRSV